MEESYNTPSDMLAELEAVEQKYLLDLPRYQRSLKLWFIRQQLDNTRSIQFIQVVTPFTEALGRSQSRTF